MEAIQGGLAIDNVWVVEFSISQKAFHRSILSEMLKNNWRNLVDRKQNDYVVIGVFPTIEEADDYIESSYDSIKNYSMFRSWDSQTIVV